MALVHINFESEFLATNTDVNIILPDKPREKTPAQFYGSGAKYKVLWLLHGTFGDYTDWIRKSNIELYACEKDLIVVMPSGNNANYVNWPTFCTGYNAWDYLFEELMPLIYNWFPASDKREDNFIAGLSMGGYGSFLYTLHHPDMFSACAPLSAAIFDDSVMERRQAESHKDLFGRLFGPGLDYWHKNSVLKMLSELDKENLPRIRYYIDCGDQDGLLDGNFQAHKIMREKGMKHEFRVRGGGHTWLYWRTALPNVLEFVSGTFRRNQ